MNKKNIFKVHYKLHEPDVDFIIIDGNSYDVFLNDAKERSIRYNGTVTISVYSGPSFAGKSNNNPMDKVTRFAYPQAVGFVRNNVIEKVCPLFKLEKKRSELVWDPRKDSFESDEPVAAANNSNNATEIHVQETVALAHLLTIENIFRVHQAMHDRDASIVLLENGEQIAFSEAHGWRRCCIGDIMFTEQNMHDKGPYAQRARKGEYITWIRCSKKAEEWGIICNQVIERGCKYVAKGIVAPTRIKFPVEEEEMSMDDNKENVANSNSKLQVVANKISSLQSSPLSQKLMPSSPAKAVYSMSPNVAVVAAPILKAEEPIKVKKETFLEPKKAAIAKQLDYAKQQQEMPAPVQEPVAPIVKKEQKKKQKAKKQQRKRTTIKPTETVYCFCGKSWNEQLAMISCEKCETWYFNSCMGITEDDASKLKFMCPGCTFTKSDMHHVIQELQAKDENSIFAKPVPKKLTEYHKKITKPMDFATLSLLLDKDDGMHLEDFLENVKLIFDNCVTFNQNTVTHNLATLAEQFLDQYIEQAMWKIWKQNHYPSQMPQKEQEDPKSEELTLSPTPVSTTFQQRKRYKVKNKSRKQTSATLESEEPESVPQSDPMVTSPAQENGTPTRSRKNRKFKSKGAAKPINWDEDVEMPDAPAADKTFAKPQKPTKKTQATEVVEEEPVPAPVKSKEAYCYCCKPYVEGETPMIQCSKAKCHRWYFNKCIGLPMTEGEGFDFDKLKFHCPHCMFAKDDFLLVLQELNKCEGSEWFAAPVDAAVVEDVYDYKLVIEQPMDYETLTELVESGKIRSFAQFYNKVKLIFTNCIQFNDGTQAQVLADAARRYLSNHIEQCIWKVWNAKYKLYK